MVWLATVVLVLILQSTHTLSSSTTDHEAEAKAARPAGPPLLSATSPLIEDEEYLHTLPCKAMHTDHDDSDQGLDASCLSPSLSHCKRRVVDGLFTTEDISTLRQIAEKGMSTRENVGGPTILDINTGFIRDSLGLDNLFALPNDLFSVEDFRHYASIIQALKDAVMQTFDLSSLYFTAPTFITRLDATKDWEAREIHDEYWHAHADHNNTAHYHYSGLLYMSTYGEDFTGGRLLFYDPDKYLQYGEDPNVKEEELVDLIVEPRRGRVIIFSSGHENVHRVEKVLSGQRHVLSFWFTCNPQKEFQIFLDGHAHVTFSKKIKQAIIAKQSKGKK